MKYQGSFLCQDFLSALPFRKLPHEPLRCLHRALSQAAPAQPQSALYLKWLQDVEKEKCKGRCIVLRYAAIGRGEVYLGVLLVGVEVASTQLEIFGKLFHICTSLSIQGFILILNSSSLGADLTLAL